MTRSTKQWILVALLACIPLTMIVINGRRAMEGILWQPMEASSQCETAPQYPEIQFGVFDPNESMDQSDLLDLEMTYLSWLNFDRNNSLMKLREIDALRRMPVITLEPWNKDDRRRDQLLQAILDGSYDEEIDRFIGLIKDFGNPVMISFAHEMDQDLADRYPWSAMSPELFTEAYQYFWKRVEISVPQDIQWVWAPVVKPNCLDYWPGDNFVDVVGMPIYSFPEWDKSYYGYIRPFKETTYDKVQYLQDLQKPVMIVEFGVTGGQFFQHYWLQEAFAKFGSIPNIHSVVFFQASDTEGAWGEGFATPDWTSDHQLLSDLIHWYNEQVQPTPELQMQATL